MTPYYADDHVTLYHARWEDVDPALLAADVLVTDPPYGIGHPTDYAKRKRGRLTATHDYPRVEGDDKPFDPAPLLALGLPSVLFGGNHFASRLPSSPTWLVWDKRDGIGSNDQADGEVAWSNLGGPLRIFRHMWSGMLKASDRGESYHPTQKPVALMRWVIQKCPPGTILDPYAGSGTTLVAAKSLGRKAIGVECVERVRGGRRQPAPAGSARAVRMTETDGRFRHASGDDEQGCVPCYSDQWEEGLTEPNIIPCTTPEPDPDEPGVCRFCSHTLERAA